MSLITNELSIYPNNLLKSIFAFMIVATFYGKFSFSFQ